MEENKNNQNLTTEEVKLAITEVISEVKKEREAARVASESGELKRNPFQNLDEEGLLTADDIVKEWDAIQKKQSSLSSGKRKVVQHLVWMALRKAAIKKAKENTGKEAQEKEAKSIPKNPRTRKKKTENKASEK